MSYRIEMLIPEQNLTVRCTGVMKGGTSSFWYVIRPVDWLG